MTLHLAVYGTLMSGQQNPISAGVRAALRSLGPCRIPGLLYAVGPDFRFPGLLPDDQATVQGELLCIADPTAVQAALAELDAYERFDPADPEGSAFIRRTVRLREPDRDALVYHYNPAATGAELAAIESGVWTDFQARRTLSRG